MDCVKVDLGIARVKWNRIKLYRSLVFIFRTRNVTILSHMLIIINKYIVFVNNGYISYTWCISWTSRITSRGLRCINGEYRMVSIPWISWVYLPACSWRGIRQWVFTQPSFSCLVGQTGHSEHAYVTIPAATSKCLIPSRLYAPLPNLNAPAPVYIRYCSYTWFSSGKILGY